MFYFKFWTKEEEEEEADWRYGSLDKPETPQLINKLKILFDTEDVFPVPKEEYDSAQRTKNLSKDLERINTRLRSSCYNIFVRGTAW